ncbi:glycosyl hydrolase family 28 protein [Mucilaginibacter sabulilitoris]|uniref:Glycosyl hydrolase family 28 protein n=1 Tax=Mucilaginibacter sabulilitoris TaxID=1173583 RepID=A0ABZ0TVK2_9SPHI|nr:glycosyl hydrolase family 28 protein [Mucilaginibacter sabulilitoris]WPU96897.1 glycosyl hydrolase family 28 protein [Mucilaginibacter sabulilitoris]
MKKIIALLFVSIAFPCIALAKDYLVTDYGAIGNGSQLSTKYIQQAINVCNANGGGRVVVPPGDFLTGTIYLKSHVELYLDRGAKISGSRDHADYPEFAGERGLIFALKATDVGITGNGEINGNGDAFFKGDNTPDRPFLVMIKKCSKVLVSGISLKNPAFWTFRLLYNDQVNVEGINIYAHVNFNNDGLDIDSKNVTISNCIIDTDDDALCFKSDSSFICQNVTVSNCVLASNCNFIKMGTASVGGFKNINVSNCVLRRASESRFRFWERSVPGVTEPVTGLAGIALEIVDGGVMDGININNIVMDGVQTPLFIRLGSRSNATGAARNVMISNITAKSVSRIASSITAIPGFRIENIVLRDINIQNPGGGSRSEYATKVPEQEHAYPENRMFGTSLPAYGIYLRHVGNISFYNVQFRLDAGEARPAVYIEDGHGIRISDLKATASIQHAPLIELNNVSGFSFEGCTPDKTIPLLFRIRGAQSNHISITGKYDDNIHRLYELKDSAPKKALIIR